MATAGAESPAAATSDRTTDYLRVASLAERPRKQRPQDEELI